MTIQIPEDLVRGLADIAALQNKSVEQVAVESLRQMFNPPDSPQALLEAIEHLPHPSSEAVHDMEAAIRNGRLPVGDKGAFDQLPG